MADVRLTATNPEDSSVVPVACNSKGELLLEEPIEGPQGPQGPQGPKGDDGADGADGDPFTGNFSGDVNFDGEATFAGDVSQPDFDYGVTNLGAFQIGAGGLFMQKSSSDESTAIGIYNGTTELTLDIKGNGSATFGGSVGVGEGNLPGVDGNTLGTFISSQGRVYATTYSRESVWEGYTLTGRSPTSQINADGSATFADGKAGFNSAGELIFFSRGQRYKAVVQNGNMMADEYPIAQEIKEKLSGVTTDIDNPRQPRD
jgi:hypothetical protein